MSKTAVRKPSGFTTWLLLLVAVDGHCNSRTASNAEVDRARYDGIFKEADGTPASCAAARPENF